MKYQLSIFMDDQLDHKDGHDVAPWEDINTLNQAHPDYDAKNVKMLFNAFWPGFKARFDKGEFPADASPTKVFGERKVKKGVKKTTSTTSSPAASTTSPAASTTSPAPAQKLTYEYSAELPMPAHPFTFGGPSVVDIGDEESEEEVLQKVIKKSMVEEEEDEEDDDDDAPYTGGVVQKEPLEGAKTKK